MQTQWRESEPLPPLHPGQILAEDFMAPRCINGRVLAGALQVSHSRIFNIVSHRSAITADTALRLARYFNTSPWFWMNLQIRFDLEVAEQQVPHPAARITPLEAAAVGDDDRWDDGAW
ncbi:HigA family addiction module antitoxin [Stenotrophomonas sp.]|uniref:HigA family addiction module antitoxin n=1 Tax=Stenotrophomonas sp. TaxID=69392 RepID=UPI00289D13C9|nr:HigA family addiction module antitoxin [Stenotrophomonas sp.]